MNDFPTLDQLDNRRKAVTDDGTMRQFQSGATRNSSHGKHEPAGFLSSVVVRRFSQYMDKHRMQSDGQLRDSDNWKQGFGSDVLMHSMWRHFLDIWSAWELAKEDGVSINDVKINGVDLDESLCALLFNVQAMLHESLMHNSVGHVGGDYDLPGKH